MSRRLFRVLPFLGLLPYLSSGCSSPGPSRAQDTADIRSLIDTASATSVLGADSQFTGSPYPDVGLAGLFAPRGPDQCQLDVLAGGEDSFALRMRTLKAAKKSIRIQALVFIGDEAGLRVAEVLKQKKAEGLDVRVIVDAFSNPWLQTQWMFFDLKQNGIEVEGYEAMALQWLNEVQVPLLTPHYDAQNPGKRFHEKMWIIDGETPDGIAVTGGLNVGNPYFRVDPEDPDANWRDQDVAVRGAVVGDMVAAFDRNFDYFVGVKKSRGIFNTNKYWDATRTVLDKTGKVPIHFKVKPERVKHVAELEARPVTPNFRGATCRFLQSRPRLKESYIHQAYLKLIERARSEVLIANAYFVPTPSIATALADAARRCVSVKLISNSPDTNDLPEISLVGRGYYKTLLAVNQSPEVAACRNRDAGIRIWEWVGKSTQDTVRRQGTMHSKFAVIDSRRSLVGSYNLDPRSEKLNSETAMVFDEPALSARLRRQFLDSDLQYGSEITAERAAQFESPASVVERFRKSIGDLFQDQL